MSDMQSTEAPFTLVPFLEQVNYVGIFRDGFAVAECPGFRRAGIINRQGEWVLQPHFDSVKQGERYVARSGNDYMVVGVDGSVGQRKYQAIGGFNSGLSPAKIDGKYGVIDLEENQWLHQRCRSICNPSNLCKCVEFQRKSRFYNPQ